MKLVLIECPLRFRSQKKKKTEKKHEKESAEKAERNIPIGNKLVVMGGGGRGNGFTSDQFVAFM